jgi:hypothetical protein
MRNFGSMRCFWLIKRIEGVMKAGAPKIVQDSSQFHSVSFARTSRPYSHTPRGLTKSNSGLLRMNAMRSPGASLLTCKYLDPCRRTTSESISMVY